MSASSSHNQRISGLFQKENLLVRTSKTEIWAVADADGRKYAAKMIKRNENGPWRSSFTTEFKVFSILTSGQLKYHRKTNGITPSGFPSVFYAGNHRDEYDVIVMELLSTDVFSLRQETRWNGNLSTNGYLMLAKDMLFAVMALHQYGFLHRNVKPHNFRIADGFIPILVNFSDAKGYINPSTNRHYNLRKDSFFTGTPKYASLNAHRLKTQSRRDDLISLGYSIIDIMKKSLPWDSDSANHQDFTDKNSYIKHMKDSISLTSLCYGLPVGIFQYMRAVTKLSFTETPQYNHLLQMLTP